MTPRIRHLVPVGGWAPRSPGRDIRFPMAEAARAQIAAPGWR
ncbi:hypothetical protein [Aureimonas sp. AU22]|nr:hypothetical protein [Aureimonas sp. AU22]